MAHCRVDSSLAHSVHDVHDFHDETIDCEPSSAVGINFSPRPIRQDIAVAVKRLREHRAAYRYAKRILDFLFALTVIIVFSWLFIIVAIAIKIDDPHGPVLFRQPRVGTGGRIFMMYKFRSMVSNAEEILEQLKEQNEKTGPVFKMEHDPRITRVGHIIRALSIDELPQFFNVLRGDLSVVGPRPAIVHEVEQYTPYQMQRLLVPQGLTCLWQIKPHRDKISFDEWVELDLKYITKCSLWTDFKIIFHTVLIVITAQGL